MWHGKTMDSNRVTLVICIRVALYLLQQAGLMLDLHNPHG